MPIAQFTLPTDERISLAYLRRWPRLGDMIYLQGVRSGRLPENSLTARQYRAMVPFYATRLANLATGNDAPRFDATVSPPSARDDANPYRNEVLGRRQGLLDLTSRFSRRGRLRAANTVSIDEMRNEFVYRPVGDEGRINSLLIVDESLASGRTVAALLAHLRGAGLPGNCIICVAVAAHLPAATERK